MITLAYLEGQTNRQIAATLGVSVATARRRLWAALERLELYVSAAGAWLAALLVGFSVYMLSRLAKLTESADTAQRVAATVTVGVLAAAAVGVVTSSRRRRTAACVAEGRGAGGNRSPGDRPFLEHQRAAGRRAAQPDQQVLSKVKKSAADPAARVRRPDDRRRFEPTDATAT